MALHQILIEQDFPATVNQVFGDLSDHNRLGEILGQNIKRIKDGADGNINGVGSVRQIKVFGSGAFEETVTAFEKNRLIEYRVTKGSPIKNHLGRLTFTENSGATHLHYTIDYEPKLPIPFWGNLLHGIIRGPIAGGLARYAKSLQK
jgi:hypothetical protein